MAGSQDRERRRLVTAVEKRLAGDGSVPPGFAADLFARVSLEDFAACPPETLAASVRAAAALLGKRIPGRPLVRIVDEGADDGPPQDAVTLVAILNDNMPFLVDSILGELQDAGASIRLVAHPILTVLRDRRGRLLAFHGTGAGPDGAIRESLIHVLVALPGKAEREALRQRLESLLAEASPEAELDESQFSAQLDAALRRLSPMVRGVLFLKLRDG
ncbi:MAG TPA: NAD-glutamate dehydrogenase, partial [Bauldia sp.]|nr:NAD-glutamate dehydrogenase [Bauldia sp.]